MIAPSPLTRCFLAVAAIGLLACLWQQQKQRSQHLAQQLQQSQQATRINQEVIEQLSQQQQLMAAQLAQKQSRIHQQQEQLRDNLAALEAATQPVDCYHQPWPEPILERLHAHY